MTPTRRFRTASAVAALAVLVPAVGATAQEDTTTTVSFAVTGAEGLSISTDGTSATLTESAGAATGALPKTTVTDARGGLLELTWNVAVQGSGYTHSADNSIAASAGRAYLPIADATELVNVGMTPIAWENEAASTNNLASSYSLISGTSLLGALGTGSIEYTPHVRVDIPDGQLGGTYTGTVTQTVSGS